MNGIDHRFFSKAVLFSLIGLVALCAGLALAAPAFADDDASPAAADSSTADPAGADSATVYSAEGSSDPVGGLGASSTALGEASSDGVGAGTDGVSAGSPLGLTIGELSRGDESLAREIWQNSFGYWGELDMDHVVTAEDVEYFEAPRYSTGTLAGGGNGLVVLSASPDEIAAWDLSVFEAHGMSNLEIWNFDEGDVDLRIPSVSSFTSVEVSCVNATSLRVSAADPTKPMTSGLALSGNGNASLRSLSLDIALSHPDGSESVAAVSHFYGLESADFSGLSVDQLSLIGLSELSSIDASQTDGLVRLDVRLWDDDEGAHPIDEIKLPASLERLVIGAGVTTLSALDASGCGKLSELDVAGLGLASLVLGGNSSLTELYAGGNHLKSLSMPGVHLGETDLLDDAQTPTFSGVRQADGSVVVDLSEVAEAIEPGSLAFESATFDEREAKLTFKTEEAAAAGFSYRFVTGATTEGEAGAAVPVVFSANASVNAVDAPESEPDPTPADPGDPNAPSGDNGDGPVQDDPSGKPAVGSFAATNDGTAAMAIAAGVFAAVAIVAIVAAVVVRRRSR